MKARPLIAGLTPPLLLDASRRLRATGLRFREQPSWAAARAAATGYDSASIVEQVAMATREVIAGRAAFERDGLAFTQAPQPFHVLAGLLKAAALNGGHLVVVDFGGSLGTLYRQCRPFLAGLASVRWRVIEQPLFVQAGRREFATEELSFHAAGEDLPAAATTHVLLLSSVLQYLPDPLRALQSLLQMKPSHIIVDRTPISMAAMHRLCVQHVPRYIYEASYPCWIFSRNLLMNPLSTEWRVLTWLASAEKEYRTDAGLRFEFQGFIIEEKK